MRSWRGDGAVVVPSRGSRVTARPGSQTLADKVAARSIEGGVGKGPIGRTFTRSGTAMPELSKSPRGGDDRERRGKAEVAVTLNPHCLLQIFERALQPSRCGDAKRELSPRFSRCAL